MILLSPLPHRFDLYPCGEALPGCAPGSAVTFFCFAKRKSPKKRRAEVRAATRFLALLASGGVGLNSLRSNNARPDPPAAALLSPATRHKYRTANDIAAGQGRAVARPCWLLYLDSPAVMRRRVAQDRAEKGAHMFEPAGRVCAHPARAEQRSVPAQPGDESGSPSFAYFSWRSKKSEAAVGPQSRHQAAPAGARLDNALSARTNEGAH